MDMPFSSTLSDDRSVLPLAQAGTRSWFDWASPHSSGADAVDLPGPRVDVARALFINGPAGLARRILAPGPLTIGRGPDADIVVDDPCVSRSHAVLDNRRDLTLRDLGSSNGTTIGALRLRSGEPVRLGCGEAFFLGHTALVVHAFPARPLRLRRLPALADVRHHILAGGASLTAVLRITPAPGTCPKALQAILEALACPPGDWTVWPTPAELLVGIEIGAPVDLAPLESAARSRLASWGVSADVDSLHLTRAQVEAEEADLAALFGARGPLCLKRGTIILRDPTMKNLVQAAKRVASAAVSVLILGETGTGKDVVASMVHEFSARAEKPFLGINCASVPETLLESEVFGHERGAFTGATVTKPGLLETASGGTVFLDEVGDLPVALQAKLLRVIETCEVTRIGAVRPRHIDVRFVAATNQNIAKAVAEGRFRQDLLYRLNCVTLTVPPLRERPAEIEPLARLFLDRACRRFNVRPMELSTAALDALEGYPWPGNVRELRNVIERAALLAPSDSIAPDHLELADSMSGSQVTPKAAAAADEAPTSERAGPKKVGFDPGQIAHALMVYGGNQSRAAKFLGMSRRTLVRHIARLGLPRPRASAG